MPVPHSTKRGLRGEPARRSATLSGRDRAPAIPSIRIRAGECGIRRCTRTGQRCNYGRKDFEMIDIEATRKKLDDMEGWKAKHGTENTTHLIELCRQLLDEREATRREAIEEAAKIVSLLARK